jgi:hypothetical protein
MQKYCDLSFVVSTLVCVAMPMIKDFCVGTSSPCFTKIFAGRDLQTHFSVLRRERRVQTCVGRLAGKISFARDTRYLPGGHTKMGRIHWEPRSLAALCKYFPL